MPAAQRGYAIIEIVVVVVVVFVVYQWWRTVLVVEDPHIGQSVTQSDVQPDDMSDAVYAGNQLSHNNCSDEGPVTLTHSPMDPDDFLFVIPYGLTVGSHVTPIDHQYFSPASYNSPRDAYPVYALADAKIVDIQHRLISNAEGIVETDEYRLVFMHTCTFFTYFDLVTSLSPRIKQAFDATAHNNYAVTDIDVVAGEEIGRIGGQTLDFAVWDTEKQLTGFADLSMYTSEYWKQFTADPYLYYAPDLKVFLTERNLRTAEPIAGKIDYDVPGKLIGNWFLKDTNGYEGKDRNAYWSGHLSIAYDHLDPTGVVISVGDYGGTARQFAAGGVFLDPATVDQGVGMVRYDLRGIDYVMPNGESWDGDTLVRGLRLRPGDYTQGCMLFELIGEDVLNVEPFPNQSCSKVDGFTDAARVYER